MERKRETALFYSWILIDKEVQEMYKNHLMVEWQQEKVDLLACLFDIWKRKCPQKNFLKFLEDLSAEYHENVGQHSSMHHTYTLMENQIMKYAGTFYDVSNVSDEQFLEWLLTYDVKQHQL